VVLIGDAAAMTDPTIGQGMSLTLRDARVLRDHLLSHGDWDAAGHGYVEHHDQAYAVLHTVEYWLKALLLETGPKAEARRTQALPLIGQDGTLYARSLWPWPGRADWGHRQTALLWGGVSRSAAVTAQGQGSHQDQR
jgi:2-polyprenyl-6-methoxyphenol hydroxylase-like FAD-dependent oxidoreductase